ncbi:MAG: SDR family oxidoreductase [Rhodocyclaceae bacterium]|jgi:NAD(P)-dependent dehydrogenase (short-subunit alcohol dehydrogenase family)|nr:SDR family oxidoreductase [Rhodocyclaceae bacterium]
MAKDIVVIGATGDVGQGIVDQLLRAGYRVIAAGRSVERLERLRSRLAGVGVLEVVAGSVEDEDAAASLVEQVGKLAHRLAGVVVSVNAPLEAMSLPNTRSGAFMEVLRTNLATHLVAAKSFIPALPAGANYLAIGGGMADLVVPGMGVLSMCQAAQRVMFRVLAEEMKDRGVRIQELMLVSMIAGESKRGQAHPKWWITDEEVGRHVLAILENPDWFPEPILTLKSRKEVGLRPTA